MARLTACARGYYVGGREPAVLAFVRAIEETYPCADREAGQ